jgi:hypothetical protein
MESVQADNLLTDRAAAPELDSARGRASLVDPFGRAISYLRVSVTAAISAASTAWRRT